MLKKEEYETLINKIKGNIDDTQGALISEDLLSVVSNYNSALDEIDKINKENETLKKDKDELLKVNGKLFQKIGFEKEEEKPTLTQGEQSEIKIEDIINDKGELI